MGKPNENKHLIRKHLGAIFYYFHMTLVLCNVPLAKQKEKRIFQTETFQCKKCSTVKSLFRESQI